MFISKLLRLFPFFDDEGGGSGIDLPNLSDIGVLEEGSEEVKEEKEEETEEEETEEETDEDTTESDEEESTDEETNGETEDEEETDETDEETEEIQSSDGRISVKALKEKYPNIFKENPGLKDVIYREREYSKHFGTVEDAEEAAEKAQTFDNFEKSIMQGEIGELLDAVADTDQDAAVSIAEKFLPELYRRSQPLFAKVTLPVIKGVIRSTFTRAQNTGNKQLSLACQYLTRDLFESSDVMKATEYREEEPDPRKDEIRQEREKLVNQQYEASRKDVLDGVKSRLRKDIIPKLGGNISDFVRDALVDKIFDELDSTLTKDRAHMARLSSLWKRARGAGFTNEAKAKIISASLGRAKSVLPAIISRVKAKQSDKKDEKKVVVKGKADKQIPNQRSSNKTGNRQPAKLGRNVSDFDFISQP